ncbi:MAG TPA: RNA polymerase sigma factor [Acidimicrobiia bacterium]|nr:RNA polymerase sigma factor [Acidimicrobiia bacterium]
MDHEVLERFRIGDEAAVKAVYDRYGGPVFALSMSILGEHGLAADATQQTFIKAWRAATSYDPERSFGPWIYAIARRTAIDMYRKQARIVVSDEVDVAVLAPGLETAWEVFEVRSAIDRLPDEERQVVKLSHFDGLTHVEISLHLDIPVGTVKSRSHRAHQRLVELLRHVEEA